jgi:hypothetical protein
MHYGIVYNYVWLTNICISTVICDRTWIRARMIYSLYITGYRRMILIKLGQDSEQWQVTVNTVINFRASLTGREIVSIWGAVRFSRRILLHLAPEVTKRGYCYVQTEKRKNASLCVSREGYNLGDQVIVTIILCTVALNICESSVRNFILSPFWRLE